MFPHKGISMNPNGLHQFAWSVANTVFNSYIKGLDDILSMPGHPTTKMSATLGYVTLHIGESIGVEYSFNNVSHIFGSHNALAPTRRQAIIWTNDG